MNETTREARLLKVYALANEICKNYTFEKYCDMLDLCKDDIFYSDGEDNDFYIEDEHFVYED